MPRRPARPLICTYSAPDGSRKLSPSHLRALLAGHGGGRAGDQPIDQQIGGWNPARFEWRRPVT
eukprot:scaffold49937_cov28-Phaeocystis_antarctica.AAC.1